MYQTVRNLLIILNIVLLLAVVFLFYTQFGGDVAEQKTETVQSQGVLNIAYVNSDSLFESYAFFKDKVEALEKMKTSLNEELNRKTLNLQKQYQDFQQTVPNMTQIQAKKLEEDLMRQQQDLYVFQEQSGQQILTKESQINNELFGRVSGYLKDYSQKNNLQAVYTYAKGSSVLYMDTIFDITAVVIQDLNRLYQEELDTANPSGDTK